MAVDVIASYFSNKSVSDQISIFKVAMKSDDLGDSSQVYIRFLKDSVVKFGLVINFIESQMPLQEDESWEHLLERMLLDVKNGKNPIGVVGFSPTGKIELCRNLGFIDFVITRGDERVYFTTEVRSTRPLDGIVIEEGHVFRNNLSPNDLYPNIVLTAFGFEVHVPDNKDKTKNIVYQSPLKTPLSPGYRTALYESLDTKKPHEIIRFDFNTDFDFDENNPFHFKKKKLGNFQGFGYRESNDGLIAYTFETNTAHRALTSVVSVIESCQFIPKKTQEEMIAKFYRKSSYFLSKNFPEGGVKFLDKCLDTIEKVETINKAFESLHYHF